MDRVFSPSWGASCCASYGARVQETQNARAAMRGPRDCVLGYDLVAEPELTNERPVLGDVRTLQVVEETASLANQHQQAAA